MEIVAEFPIPVSEILGEHPRFELHTVFSEQAGIHHTWNSKVQINHGICTPFPSKLSWYNFWSSGIHHCTN
jgi:hypothetical protein